MQRRELATVLRILHLMRKALGDLQAFTLEAHGEPIIEANHKALHVALWELEVTYMNGVPKPRPKIGRPVRREGPPNSEQEVDIELLHRGALHARLMRYNYSLEDIQTLPVLKLRKLLQEAEKTAQ